jgi:hypothetical protein
MLTRVDIDLFLFYMNFLFQFHPSILSLIYIELLYFSMRITQPHNAGNEFFMLTRIGLGFLHYLTLFCFYINFDPHSFNYIFSALDFFLKKIHHSTLDWLRIGLCNFFLMWWSLMTQVTSMKYQLGLLLVFF